MERLNRQQAALKEKEKDNECIHNYNKTKQANKNIYILLTKREVKMAGYWPSSLFAFLWTETKSRSIKT